MPFPSVFSTFARPTATDRLSSPSHSALHNTTSSALGQVEAVIGTDASTLGTIIGDLRNTSSEGGGHVQSARKGGTGQTTYTKGDLLVGQSSSVLTKLAAGSTGQTLRVDPSQAVGLVWGNAGVDRQTFSSIGTWTKSSIAALTSMVWVRGWGAGGSGGTAGNTSPGGGGGGGAYGERWIVASLLGSTEQANVSVGGASVLAANTAGNAGGNTVFGASSILTAYGGGGGHGSAASFHAGGGGGGRRSAGVTSAGTVGGNGGSPNPQTSAPSVLGGQMGLGGIAGQDGAGNVDGGGGGGGANSGNGGSGGDSTFGGGAGGGSGGTSNGGSGGDSTYGGGGGAGGGTGGGIGTSLYGGNGGAGGTSVLAGTSGSVLGGGGGGTVNGQPSGSGGNGFIEVITFF